MTSANLIATHLSHGKGTWLFLKRCHGQGETFLCDPPHSSSICNIHGSCKEP